MFITVAFWYLLLSSLSVSDRWDVGSGDDVWPAVKEIQVKPPHICQRWFTEDGFISWHVQTSVLFRCSVLMLDEAHERTLYTDIAIGLLKKVTLYLLWIFCQMSISVWFFGSLFSLTSQIQKKRRDLRLIVASATLDAKVSLTSDPNYSTCEKYSLYSC